MADNTNDPVAALIQAHLADELRGYHGNLAWAMNVVQNQWLPEIDSPGIQDHLQTLRQHMAMIGHAEDDTFLLRLGLIIPGMQRGIVPPVIVLEPNRGGFPPKRQREAEGHILRLRDALAIGRLLMPSLSPDTQQAFIELTDISRAKLEPKDLALLRLFQNLTIDQANSLADKAIELMDSDLESISDIGTEILQHVACFGQLPLTESCCSTLIDRDVFWPTSMFCDAADLVATKLISKIEHSTELLQSNHLLLALAWTRSNAALKAFIEWDAKPPLWASKLHILPSAYANSAGWCIEEGQRRDLISKNCFRLTPAESPSARSVPFRTRTNRPCPSCGGHLVLLFDFSALGAEYFRGDFADAPRKILSCLFCSCYEPTFVTYHRDGDGEWLSPVEPRELEYEWDQQDFLLELGDSPCPPFACAEAFALDNGSTFCGIPMWLQDAEFPRCIECGRVMTFLAQHDNCRLGEEGIHYAFFCASCHVAAVTYQQT
jgi:hypothetical protein